MENTMTLVAAVRQLEENGTIVKVGNFDSFESFMSYFNIHYKTMLKKLQTKSRTQKNSLKGFFIDDMLEAFSE